MPLTQEQIQRIQSLNPEQKAQAIKEIQGELTRRQGGQSTGGRILSGVGRGLQAGLKALPYVINDKMPPGDESKALQSELLKLQLEEKVKDTTDPNRRMALMKEASAKKQIADAQTNPIEIVGIDNVANIPTSSVTPVSSSTQDTSKVNTFTPKYIKVPTGKYNDLTGLPEYKYDLSPESEAQSAAMKTRATKQAETEAAMQPALKIIKTLKKNWIDVFPDAPKKGKGLNRFDYGAKKSWEAFTQENPKVARYLNTRKAYLSLLVRGLGEKGVLTNPDIERVATAIGSQWDTKEVAIGQFGDLEKLLSGDIQGYIDRGGNPGAIEEVINNVKNQVDPLGIIGD